MVPADSCRISRAPQYSGYFQELKSFHLQDYHPLWFNFPEDSTSFLIFYSLTHCISVQKSHNTWSATNALFNTLHGLGSFRFARRYSGNHFVFFSSRYLDVSVPWVGFSLPMYSVTDVRTLLLTGCPIRKSPGLRLLPSYRGLSQVAASFIAFKCRGIHCMPFVT